MTIIVILDVEEKHVVEAFRPGLLSRAERSSKYENPYSNFNICLNFEGKKNQGTIRPYETVSLFRLYKYVYVLL